MRAFILLAAGLASLAVLLVAVPLLRRRADVAPAPKAAISAALVILCGAVAGYLAWTDFTWTEVASGTEPQHMVAQLARRLERHPDDLQGWLMLGHSYVVLQQLPLAVRAYERADRLANGQSVDAMI